MGCAVTPPTEVGGVEEVTFLYRLTDGACPKSYGAHVARLAGLPDEVVRRAAHKANESEAARKLAGMAGAEEQRKEEEELLARVQAACKGAAAGDAGCAAEAVRLQGEVRRLLRLAPAP